MRRIPRPVLRWRRQRSPLVTNRTASHFLQSDGRHFAFPLRGGSIQLSDTQTSFISVCPDGKRALSASGDSIIRAWSSDTDDMIFGPLQGHTEEVNLRIGGRNVSASDDTTIHISNLDTGDMVLEPFGRLHRLLDVCCLPSQTGHTVSEIQILAIWF
jgi:WD40 repeat protein